MSSAAVSALVLAQLDAAWTLTPVRRPNADFDPGGRPFVEVAFPGADVQRGAIGDASNPLWDEAGAFMCHVFVPANTGDAVARQLADALGDLFLRWDAPLGLTIWRRLASQEGARTVQGRPWYGVSFGLTYQFHTIG
ncbi:phage tail terminator-like protein [Roseospira visakhapatnamensis]|uniref:DUF3168 domain-containing protein n=1 Tax=Roseospira visakhapatnamensis TaxID=390880 RepID=A0A7W6RFQ1_9PROT|nr:phage tail terminator-like protein [Roseospira visakhapatnamensis]MBB4267730.1 hypothetical protein [Roseospira visakhapatnamensis]